MNVHPNGHLSEAEIRTRLAAHPAQVITPPTGVYWRRASVLVPLLRVEDQWHLLFIRRTQQVSDHKGQVAFPGGAAEPTDRDAVDTALREAEEEIGLPPSGVDILGRMSDYFTISNYLISPVVGLIRQPFIPQLSLDEVERVFSIPLSWLARRGNYEEKLYTRPNGSQEMVIFFSLFDQELLWGITARITVNFLTILGLFHD